ncbi:DUF4333 domain-containing protein [Geodermatophilus sp. SYSU D00815]
MRRIAVLLLGLGLLTGCADSVAAADVAAAVAEDLEARTGARPAVDCPEDLPAEVGATARCTVTLEGVEGEYGVTATVTEVEDGRAFFDIQVDPEPLPG